MRPHKVWRAKSDILGYIAYTSLRVPYVKIGTLIVVSLDTWVTIFFYLNDIKFYSNNYVRFSEGARGKIIGKRKLDYHGLPYLNDILLVDALNSNLISITQLYYQDLYVNFNKVKRTITNKNHA